MRMLRTGVTPRAAPRVPRALIMLYNRLYDIILCGCYACGPNPRALAHPHDTKTPLMRIDRYQPALGRVIARFPYVFLSIMKAAFCAMWILISYNDDHDDL
jgi:hypothetical protein